MPSIALKKARRSLNIFPFALRPTAVMVSYRATLQTSHQDGLWKSRRVDPLDFCNRLRQLFKQKRTDLGTLRRRSPNRIPGPKLMTLRQSLQDFRRRHRNSFPLASVALVPDLGANKKMRLKGSDRPPRQRALHASKAARSRLCPICEASMRASRTVLFPPQKRRSARSRATLSRDLPPRSYGQCS